MKAKKLVEHENYFGNKRRLARKRQGTAILTRVDAGFYLWYSPLENTLYSIEKISKRDGFSANEWHFGPFHDPHADQAATLGEVREWIEDQLRKFADLYPDLNPNNWRFWQLTHEASDGVVTIYYERTHQSSPMPGGPRVTEVRQITPQKYLQGVREK